MKKHFFIFLSFLFVAGCDTMPAVSSRIVWNAPTVDQDCIREAIEATPTIKMGRQEIIEAGGTCILGDCSKRFYRTFYTVTENKTYPMAYVDFEQTISGKINLTDRGPGAMNRELPEEDRAGFTKAQIALNDSIRKFCPAAGPSTFK
jgi:hypothetical protein